MIKRPTENIALNRAMKIKKTRGKLGGIPGSVVGVKQPLGKAVSRA